MYSSHLYELYSSLHGTPSHTLFTLCHTSTNRCNCMLLPCLAGEASAPADALWLMSRVRGYRPALEYCGGTELAGEGHLRIVLMLLHPRRRVLHFR